MGFDDRDPDDRAPSVLVERGVDATSSLLRLTLVVIGRLYCRTQRRHSEPDRAEFPRFERHGEARKEN